MSDPAAALVTELRRLGFADETLLGAFARVPRALFVPPTFGVHAWEDVALPIGHGQTISKPSVVARMTLALEVTDRHSVLEVGTGSGYQTAILARLARRVFTIERHRGLVREAEARFREMRLGNVIHRFGDGTKGWPEAAPFERILVTASAPSLPERLLAQLAPGGILVAPLGAQGRDQSLMRVRIAEDGARIAESLGPVRFVPLVEGLPRGTTPRSDPSMVPA